MSAWQVTFVLAENSWAACNDADDTGKTESKPTANPSVDWRGMIICVLTFVIAHHTNHYPILMYSVSGLY